MDELKSYHYFISGRVQGVWYRASAQKKGLALGLKGWVRNLADGRVESVAVGTPELLAEYLDWLKRGPILAKVTSVAVDECSPERFDTFGVK